MKRKIFHRFFAVVISAAVFATSVPAAMEAEAATIKQPARVWVHDPSIIKADGKYYVFGSHLADAKSDDLITWEQMNIDFSWRDWKNDSVYGEVLVNLAGSFAWAGYDDGDVRDGGLGVWAPDVIYNPDYVWEDGSEGAYMLYYSTTSSWKRSCIGYGVSKDVEGPYDYVDTIIYSGFTTTGAFDHGANGGHSERNTKWDNDYLNLSRLIEEDLITDIKGDIEEGKCKWFTKNGDWNELYAPNAIDPTIFYAKDGKMYMVYGSWSGGLFIHELDKTTGGIIYPYEDDTDSSENFIDRYFGVHIAGGNHQSGEGGYILYDKEADYYYLYETYGKLDKMGGYNMRLFRSKNVYGPYLDAAGNNAADNGGSRVDNYNEAYGIKLIGNYQFKDQQGYRSAGHNSALIDDDGQHYLIYHQRFDSNQFGIGHEVRVHQQFLNEDGWPVTAVYEYVGEQIRRYNDADVVGSYELVNHGTDNGKEMIKTQSLELKADGTVTVTDNDETDNDNDETVTDNIIEGTWTKTTGEGKDYDYLTMVLGEGEDEVTYKGIFYKQHTEEASARRVMTFSVVGSNNTCLWGSGLTEFAEEPPADVEDKPPVNVEEKPPVETKKDTQTISAKSVYTGVYGKKSLSLNAKLTKGNGALSYVSDNPKVADVDKTTGKVTIKGMGVANITITASETDTFKQQQMTVTVKIAPKKMTLTSAKSKALKKVALKWKSVSKVSGYQIQYAEKSNFKNAKTVTVKSAKTTTKTITKLKKKTYYFRIRAYVKSGKTSIYGDYSKAKKVKVK